MKIYLKKNWSEQFICGDDSPGYFVGRQREIDSLKNVILENDSSSVLISSVRGVGKTSFVHKAVDECIRVTRKKGSKEIRPIFVNIGHALSASDTTKSNKELMLNSLIRATHLIFPKDNELKNIYKQSIGNYKEQEGQEKIDTQERSFKLEIQQVIRLNNSELLGLAFVFILFIGTTIDSYLWRTILTVFSASGLFFSFNLKKEWIKTIFNKSEITIDDSVEWLEIKFEEWLKNYNKKLGKIVFIIDELDKIKPEESFLVIKEFKNIFTRSFTHFIFIAGEKAFTLIGSDREDEKNGSFPTLFTHSFYLSLPTSDELRMFLKMIIDVEGEFPDINSYLLFKAKNDFFELKRLILDYTQYENGRPFLDVDLIRKEEVDYLEIIQIYNFIDKSAPKYLRQLKKYWQDNYILQKDFFDFLHQRFNRNFSNGGLNENQLLLVDMLERAEIIREFDKKDDEVGYMWTHNYLISKYDDLFDEEQGFVNKFEEMIKIANDLNDFQSVYLNNNFNIYKNIQDGKDGGGLTGVNLFSLFSKYYDLYKALNTKENILNLRLENSKSALDEITQNIENITKSYFSVFDGLLNAIFSQNGDLFFRENLASGNFNITGTINQFPDFYQNLSINENVVCGRRDQTRFVFIVKDFVYFDKIRIGLESLSKNKNILFINLSMSEKVEMNNAFFIKSIHKRGKAVLSRKIEVKNFINYSFSEYRDLSIIASKIGDFLK